MFVIRTKDHLNQTIPVEIDEGREYQIITSPNDGSPSVTYTGTGRRGVLRAVAQMLYDQFAQGRYAAFNREFYEREVLPMRERELEAYRTEYNAVGTYLSGLYDNLEFMDDEVASDHQELFNKTIEAARKMWSSLRVYNGICVLGDTVDKFGRGALDVDARIDLDIPEDQLEALVGDGSPLTYGAFVEDFAFDMATDTPDGDRTYLMPFSITATRTGFFHRNR